MGLVRSVGNADRPHMCPHGRQWRVLTYTLCPIRLHCFIDDFKRHVRDEDLGLCDFEEGRFRITGVDGRGGVENDKASGVDVDTSLGYPVQDHALLRELLAERLLVRGVGAGQEPAEGFFSLKLVSECKGAGKRDMLTAPTERIQ